MKVNIFFFYFIIFIHYVLAQSGGGGGSAGLIGGLILIICCPCITIAMIIIYLKSKWLAKKKAEDYLNSVDPLTAGCDKIIPPSGSYKGSFTQGYASYYMNLDLTFTEDHKHNETGIYIYTVTGSGTDQLGTFYIKKGKCKVGNTIRLFFNKKYKSMNDGYKEELLYKLTYTGEMSINELRTFKGMWEFIGKEDKEDIPSKGSFNLTYEQSTNEYSINIDTTSGINLEKSPLL